MSIPLPRIAIIGAGPGGLTLASLLHTHKIPSTVFEADASRSTRDQGGILDLHPRAGQLALREAGLLELFKRHSLKGAEACRIVRRDGEVAWDDNDGYNGEVVVREGGREGGIGEEEGGGEEEKPEIDRMVLRDILIDSLPVDAIRWNHKLVSVVSSAGDGEDGNGKHDLHFTNSVEKGFDLVVGADGAWSHVRPLLTDAVPFYSGVTMIELQALNVSTHAHSEKAWLKEYVGSGSLFMFDDNRAIAAQHNVHADSIRVYACVRQPENWTSDCGIDWTSSSARQELIDRCFSDCGADLQRAILAASDVFTPRVLHMLPIGLEWKGQPGLTLLGDAAHLMTPFAGVGVNVALADALGLARALVKHVGEEGGDLDLGEAVREYEMAMFVRAKENMEKTWMGLQHHFSAEGVDERVGKLREREERRAKSLAAKEVLRN